MWFAEGVPLAFSSSWNFFTLSRGLPRSFDPWRMRTGGNFERDPTGKLPPQETIALTRGSLTAREKAKCGAHRVADDADPILVHDPARDRELDRVLDRFRESLELFRLQRPADLVIRPLEVMRDQDHI